MIEKFEYKGLWFLPSDVTRKIPGILKFDYNKNKNFLELIGSFYDFSNYEGEEIILGVTTDGDEITLTGCQFYSSTNINRNEFTRIPNRDNNRSPTLNFKITTILKGHHIYVKEDLVFQSVYTNIFNLDEWVGISGLEAQNNFENETKTIYFKTPEPIKVKINDVFDIEIRFVSNIPMRSRFSKKLKITQRTVFAIHSKRYTSMSEFLYLLRKFNCFLSSSIQKPVRIQKLELYCDKFTEINFGNNDIQKPIDAYQIINPELKFKSKEIESKMLFTYMDIKNDFENIMQKWFLNFEKYEAPFNLVLSQYYVSIYYLENLFINVAQAAESFHRRLNLINDTPKTEQDKIWNDKVRIIIENTPEDLKNWVKSQISKPSKHFYDTRLNYLLKEFSNNELDKMIGDHSSFVKNISISRNYYTHFNSELEAKALHGNDLVLLYQKLRLLLICGFLIESGFTKSLLESLIKDKSFNMFSNLRTS